MFGLEAALGKIQPILEIEYPLLHRIEMVEDLLPVFQQLAMLGREPALPAEQYDGHPHPAGNTPGPQSPEDRLKEARAHTIHPSLSWMIRRL